MHDMHHCLSFGDSVAMSILVSAVNEWVCMVNEKLQVPLLCGLDMRISARQEVSGVEGHNTINSTVFCVQWEW